MMGSYLRRLPYLAVAVAVTGGMLAVGPVTAAGALAADGAAVCSGTLASPGVLTGTHPSSVVVKGACQVNAGRAVVEGNLSLSPGSALLAAFALNDRTGSGTSNLSVDGDLRVGAGATLVLGCNPANFPCLDAPKLSSHDSVGGDLASSQPLGVIVHNSSIGDDVTQFGGGGGRNCTPHGVFKLFKSPVYSAYEVSSVEGSVSVSGVQSCWMGLTDLRVGSDVTMLNNKLADPDAIEILANHIAGDLTCRGNSRTWDNVEARPGHLFPRIPQPNTVGENRAGQCVLSSPTKPGGPHGPGPF